MALALRSPLVLLFSIVVGPFWAIEANCQMTVMDINITSIEFKMKFVNEETRNVTIISIPRTYGCNFTCNSNSLDDHSELVCEDVDTFFSVNHTVTADQQKKGAAGTEISCRNETADGRLRIKCDATNEGAYLSVVIDHLQQTPSLPISCTHTVVENGIKFECLSSSLRITGLSYFVNARPMDVTNENNVLIGWGALDSISNIVSLGVCISTGQLYPFIFNITLEISGCDVEISEEYEDLGGEFQFTSRPINGATEVVSVTASRSEKDWSQTTDGGTFRIPKAILEVGVNIFLLEFRLMCDGRVITLERILEIVVPLPPLKLRCAVDSFPCHAYDYGVRINCSTNREVAALCSIDATDPQEECNLTSSYDISTLKRGKHEFHIKVIDSYGNTARNKVIFPVDFAVWCNAVYDYTNKLITVSCDSTRPISSSTLQINDDTPIKGDLPYTVSYKPSAKEISLKVVAQDQFGDKAIDVIYDSNILQ